MSIFNIGVLNIKRILLTGMLGLTSTAGVILLKKSLSFNDDTQQDLFVSQNTKKIKDLIKENYEETEEFVKNYITLNEYRRFFADGGGFPNTEINTDNWSASILHSLSAQKIIVNSKDFDEKLTEILYKSHGFWPYPDRYMSEKTLTQNYTSIFKQLSAKSNEKVREIVYASLIYGLLEWGEASGFYVGADIDINVNIGEVRNQFHNNGIRFQNFKFEFTITNYTNKTVFLFGKFELPPKNSWRVKVGLNNGEIKTVVRKNQNNGNTMPIIGFFPDDDNVFVVNMANIDRENETKTYSSDEIKFIYSTSPTIKTLEYQDVGINNWNRKFVNSVTWDDLEMVVKPKLKTLTAEQIKKDIERWYGTYTMSAFKLKINDIFAIIKYIQQDLFVDKQGKKINILEKLSQDQDSVFRILSEFRLDNGFKKLIGNFLDKLNGKGDAKKKQIAIKSFLAFLNSITHEIYELIKNLSQTIVWEQEPILGDSGPHFNNGYPTVSFKLKQTWKIDTKSIIHFKGIWNEQTKTTSDFKTGALQKNETSFDILDFFLNPESALQGVAAAFNAKGGFADFLPGLFTDLKEFINWNQLTFEASDSIISDYSASGSPISMGVDNTSDSLEASTGKVIGYKILDAKWSYDIRNFWTIFAQLFNKIQCYKKENEDSAWSPTIADISNSVINPIKQNPIKQVVHIINSLIGIGYKESGKSSNVLKGCTNSSTEKENWSPVSEADSQLHPWNVFFQKVFRRTFDFESKQIFVGYPQALYNYPNQFDEKVTETMQAVNSTNSVSSHAKNVTYRLFDVEELNNKLGVSMKKYPTSLKDPNLTKISENLWINWALSYPKTPVVIPQYHEIMNSFASRLNQDSRFATTEQFIKNKSSLNDFSMNILKDKNVKYFDGLPWSSQNEFLSEVATANIKSTAISLEIGAALKQLLSSKMHAGFALSMVGTFPAILENAIIREFYFYHVNMFQEQGIWTAWKLNDKIRFFRYNSTSDFYMLIPGNFDRCKINLSPAIKKAVLKGCT